MCLVFVLPLPGPAPHIAAPPPLARAGPGLAACSPVWASRLAVEAPALAGPCWCWRPRGASGCKVLGFGGPVTSLNLGGLLLHVQWQRCSLIKNCHSTRVTLWCWVCECTLTLVAGGVQKITSVRNNSTSVLKRAMSLYTGMRSDNCNKLR